MWLDFEKRMKIMNDMSAIFLKNMKPRSAAFAFILKVFSTEYGDQETRQELGAMFDALQNEVDRAECASYLELQIALNDSMKEDPANHESLLDVCRKSLKQRIGSFWSPPSASAGKKTN